MKILQRMQNLQAFLSYKVGIYFGRLSHEVEVRLEGGWDLLTSPIRRSITSSNNASALSYTRLNS